MPEYDLHMCALFICLYMYASICMTSICVLSSYACFCFGADERVYRAPTLLGYLEELTPTPYPPQTNQLRDVLVQARKLMCTSEDSSYA